MEKVSVDMDNFRFDSLLLIDSKIKRIISKKGDILFTTR